MSCALAFVVLAASAAHARAQGGWTVSVGGQSAVVNSAGSFVVSNISITDSFGPDGQGSPPDQQSDAYYRLAGTRAVAGQTHYLRSAPFRLAPNITVTVPRLVMSEYPFPALSTLTIGPSGTILLDVGDTFPLSVSGLLSDGSAVDLTPIDAGTSFTSTSAGIARVDSVGVVTAQSPGSALIVVENEGVTAAKKVRVRQPTLSTRVQGFVFTDDGAPVGGATIRREGGIVAHSRADGGFDARIEGISAEANILVLDAEAQIQGVDVTGSSGAFPILPGGISDAGILRVRPRIASLFRTAEPVLENAAPSCLESADVDGDGHADLVVWSFELARVTVILGLTDGGLARPATYEVPMRQAQYPDYSPRVRVLDVDRDGLLDILVEPGIDTELFLLLGTRSGSFLPATIIQHHRNLVYAASSAVGDLDGDGDVDVLRCGYTFGGDVLGSVALNDGDGSFASPFVVDLADAGFALDAVAVQLDLDTADEILISGYDSRFGSAVYLIEGIADSSGPSFIAISRTLAFRTLLPADFNADGNSDIALLDDGAAASAILLGDGAGGFGRPLPLPTTYGDVFEDARVADIDLDGDLDLVSVGEGALTTFLGLGDGQFDAPIRAPWSIADEGRPSFALMDVLGERSPDFLGADFVSGTIFALPGRGDGRFESPYSFISIPIDCEPDRERAPSRVGFTSTATFAPGDLDGDGDSDLVSWYDCGFIGVLGAVVLRNDGRGNFTTTQELDVQGPVVLSDLEPDGDLDLVYLGVNSLSARLNDGKGAFGAEIPGSKVDDYFTLIGLADCDGNGVQDAVVAHGSLERIDILRGLGAGQFSLPQPAIVLPPGTYAGSATLADMNGDGITDVCLATYGDPDSVGSWLGNGLGAFSPAWSHVPSNDGTCVLYGLVAADVDGDAIRDLVLSPLGCPFTPTVLRGVGDGTFVPDPSVNLAALGVVLTAADLDLDGRADFLGGDAVKGLLTVLRSSAGYEPETYPSSPSLGYSAIPFDADGDLDPDVVVSEYIYSGTQGTYSAVLLLNLTRDAPSR